MTEELKKEQDQAAHLMKMKKTWIQHSVSYKREAKDDKKNSAIN